MLLSVASLILFAWPLWSGCTAAASEVSSDRWITGTNEHDEAIALLDDRKPALYTESFGSCMPHNAISIDRFEASFFRDNMSLTFHLQGTTTLDHEDLIVSLAVLAYGERRVGMTFNPCNANLYGLCPPLRDKPISIFGLVPLSHEDVSVIPPLAMTIPDFEGQAVIQVFANSTRSQAACYAASVTNGVTMSYPRAINAILLIFTVAVVLLSSTTALLDIDVSAVREHYAHSPSLLVTLSVFHHIFYTSALAVNWPRVLVAFWSNFAWLAGLIHTDRMQHVLSRATYQPALNLRGIGCPSAGTAVTIQGGYTDPEIYPDAPASDTGGAPAAPGQLGEQTSAALVRRSLSTAFRFTTPRVDEGYTLPGNYSGFCGTLSLLNIPPQNAFLTVFIWLLVAAAILVGGIAILKVVLELLVGLRKIEEDKFSAFRRRWRVFATAILRRLLLSAFHMLVFLPILYLKIGANAGLKFLAAAVLMTTVVSAFTLVARVLLVTAEETSVESASILRRLGYLCLGSWKPKLPVSHDREYLRHFGWLSARFRQDRWWWFAPWLCYEFVRACILGGAMSNPLGQVVSSLTLEVVLLVFGSIMRPFEATRLNILGIYLLGASKVVTLAISVAFLPEFAIARIPATVLGILIIIVQGGLALTAIAFILVGCVSTHWSSRAQKSSCEDAVQAPPTSSASDGYFASEYLARINAQLQQSQASSAADLSDQSAISSIKS